MTGGGTRKSEAVQANSSDWGTDSEAPPAPPAQPRRSTTARAAQNRARSVSDGCLVPLSPEGRGVRGEGFSAATGANPSPPVPPAGPLPTGARGERKPS